jgi:hypothetical protein
MIDWPDELVYDIAARRSVVFLGAGVSRNAQNAHGVHPREWSDFLRHLSSLVPNTEQKAEITQCIDEVDLLTACELARRYLSPSAFKTEILQEFSGNAYGPAKIHDDLNLVDSRLVMTTNSTRFMKIEQINSNTIQSSSKITMTKTLRMSSDARIALC